MAFTLKSCTYINPEGESIQLDQADLVPKDSPIDLLFSTAVGSSSILAHTVALYRTMPDGKNGNRIDINLSLLTDTKTVRIIPTSDMVSGAFYALYIPKNIYGIKAADGTPLSSSYSYSFSVVMTTADVADPGTTIVEDIESIPSELYLASSSPGKGTIMQFGLGSLTVNFDGIVPAGGTCSNSTYTDQTSCEAEDETWTRDVIVAATAADPMGFGFNETSYWVDNLQNPIIMGKDIYLVSKILYSALSVEEIALLAVPGTDSILPDSILCISKTADAEGYITLDFDLNKAFEIEFDISINEHTPELTFMSLLSPFYTSLNDAKMEIGPFVEQYDDFTLSLALRRHSITASQLWGSSIASTSIPLRVTEYVMARTKKDILSTYFTDPNGAGAGSISLGDYKMSGRTLVKYLQDNLKVLDLKIVALERMLKSKDTSTTPYTDHSYISLPAKTRSASPGESVGTSISSMAIGSGRSLYKK